MLMKGQALKDPSKLVYPVWVEHKLDEIRCRVWLEDFPGLGSLVQFHSFANKPLHNLNSFAEKFAEFFAATGLTELDMGVLVNGNFNDSYRWVRSSKGAPKESIDKATGKVSPALDLSMVQFVLYDLPTDGREWQERVLERADYASELKFDYGLPVSEPTSAKAFSAGHLMAMFDDVRAQDIEGLMIKTLDHKYKRGKHTGSWWKLKPSDTVDGKITGYTEAVSEDGVPLGRVGSVDVVMEDGSTASPGGFVHALAKDIFENFEKYRDQWLEFDFMERDRKGGYRHPNFKRFREAKK